MSFDAFPETTFGELDSRPARQSTSNESRTLAPAESCDISSKSPKHKHATDLVTKHGGLYHRFVPDKAPWPLCYDPEYLELEALDRVLSTTFGLPLNIFPLERNPSRVLDLGCGTGVWILEAAQAWPECTFTGLDLVDVQIPLDVLSEETRRRISWVHGNFLTSRLPFDDDEFDLVRMNGLAKGIPEPKWGSLLEEIHRVMQPGGTIELTDEDILFPTLPEWFTSAVRPRDEHQQDYTHLPSGTTSSFDGDDYALLEKLYSSVFMDRFINMRPTDIIPLYFTTYFTKTLLPPCREFAIPPYKPMAAPTLPLNLPESRRSSRSDFSWISAFTPSEDDWDCVGPLPDTELDSSSSAHSVAVDALSDLTSAEASFIKHQRMHGEKSVPVQEERSMPGSTAAMQLHLAFQNVLACREAMWDELRDALCNRPNELAELGWHIRGELNDRLERQKFDLLLQRFRTDMQLWLGFDRSLADVDWAAPPEGSLTRAQIVDQHRLYAQLSSAHSQASHEPRICRRARALYGCKADAG